MRKIKTFGFVILFLAISLSAFAITDVTNQCDDMNVVNVIDDAAHPFWGSSTVGTYGYTAPDGSVYVFNCVRMYRVWVNFGTEAIVSDVPIYCN